jgi:hypothetical protein
MKRLICAACERTCKVAVDRPRYKDRETQLDEAEPRAGQRGYFRHSVGSETGMKEQKMNKAMSI